ncbi:hypothetical protein [uncultured Parasutterella sp.]|uniref:hypothetical protein n=5 Tax=uncultured Parasutterella sp. TaxID=1263098 RepID=UPI0025E5E26B|nr:hypothetical protein [uncultured Parasutterella sp.]
MRLYQLTLEDFTREFSSLPDKYKILLFKLQTSYCFKEEPLNEFEIAGIANAEIPLDENLLRFLNNYFVQTKEGLWKSPSVDSQSEQLENLIEKEVQKRVARALAGMKGGLSKSRNRKNQNTLVSEGEILISEVQEEQQAFCEEPEDLKQTSSKPLANGYQTPSKTVANGWQNPSKVVANAKQTSSKELANSKQSSSKPLANGYQTPSKTVANGWQNPSKVVANAKQTSSKELANSKQSSSKPLANGYQTPSKTVANGWQSSSKVVANTKQTSGKTLANENFATTEESQPVDFVEETENLQLAPEIEPEDDPSLACACVCASDNPINPISDYFLINKNNKNKSESVSESVKEKTENFKNQNSREIEKFSAGKNWTLQEAQTLLVDSGLDKKFLEAWVSRSDRNQTRFNALLSDVLPRFDREAFDLLIARCKEQKRSEGAMFAGSIAYVISALEREPVTAKRRPKKRSSERDYTEGLIQNPDGSWSPDPNYVSKTKKYSDRDWTEGLIKNPDGSYSLDPNYEH